jgi:GNAT superfamily N-acetyltransferase
MIRTAQREDEKKLFQLYQEFIVAMSQFDGDDDCNMDDEIREWIDRALLQEKSIILICERETTFVGFARVQSKQREENGVVNYGKLSDLYIIPEARRTGYAEHLIHASKEWALQQGVTEMILNVYEQNESARKLYKKCGYVEDSKISLGRIRMKYDMQNRV